MAPSEKARVFMNGRSQAVRIPAKFRFKTSEVYIRHNEATGEITLSEKPPRMTLEEIYAAFDAANAIEEWVLERDLTPPPDRFGL